MDRKVAVITGAAQGVAYLVAKQLSESHRVALLTSRATVAVEAGGECGPLGFTNG